MCFYRRVAAFEAKALHKIERMFWIFMNIIPRKMCDCHYILIAIVSQNISVCAYCQEHTEFPLPVKRLGAGACFAEDVTEYPTDMLMKGFIKFVA